MNIAICLKAIQLDGSSNFALLLRDVLMRAGHAVTLIATQPRVLDQTSPAQSAAFINIDQPAWESMVRNVARISRMFQQQRFDVVFIVTGLPARHLEHALGALPDETVLVPIVVGDRAHVYDPLKRTAALWNAVVAISPRLQQQVVERHPARPVRLLTTGIHLPSPAKLAERASLSTPMRLLFVGRLFGRKNVLQLPKILAACDQLGLPATLTICGHGTDRPALEQACRVDGVADRVSFVFAPGQADLYRIMRSHHVSLFTSSYGEGLGLVLLEAQANGCVPVASRLTGVTDFAIAEGETGLLADIGAPHAFAQHILSLSNTERWQRFSAAAVARSHRLFSLDAMKRDYGALLDDIRHGAYPLPVPRSQLPSRHPRFGRWSYLPRGLQPFIRRALELRHGRRRIDTDPE